MDAAFLNVINAVSGLPALVLYAIIVVWLVVESMAVPLPNEAILLFSGFLVATGHLNLWVAWAASIVGTVTGASLAWWIARTYGPAGVRRVGRYLFLSEARLATAHAFFQRRGALTIFLARLTPVVRTVVSYPAGLADMSYRPFALATLAGCAIWNLAMLLLGRAAGDHWSDLFRHYHTPALIVGVAVIVAVIGYLVFEHQLKTRLERGAPRA
jgi:membrane protein DedA with SNARE-associated domain